MYNYTGPIHDEHVCISVSRGTVVEIGVSQAYIHFLPKFSEMRKAA